MSIRLRGREVCGWRAFAFRIQGLKAYAKTGLPGLGIYGLG